MDGAVSGTRQIGKAAARAALRLGLAVVLAGALAGIAAAAEIRGEPHNWELGMQQAASPTMEALEHFHNYMLVPLITGISSFVLVLLLIVMIRFNRRANPVPSKNSHNTLIEVIWTGVPVAILVVVAIPSFRLLFFEAKVPTPDVTIKATGNVWNWDYEYPDLGDITFKANIIPDNEIKGGEIRLLSTDYKVVVPVNKVVHILTTSNDVIHSWAVPSFGVKIDAVPGRLNETWFKAEREGIYFGECSELCGKDHSRMPIEVHVVSDALFKKWAEAAKTDVDQAATLLAAAEGEPHVVAAADTAVRTQ